MTEAVQQKLSRNGKRPVALAGGVQATISGQQVSLKGPKGSIARTFRPEVVIEQREGALHIAPAQGSGQAGTQHQGTTRAILANMVAGVQTGYKRSLDFRGVGYRAEFKDGKLKMSVGLSHQPVLDIPKGVSITASSAQRCRLNCLRVPSLGSMWLRELMIGVLASSMLPNCRRGAPGGAPLTAMSAPGP